MATLQVRLLGQFEVRRNGQAVALPSRAAQSLLAYLVLQAGVTHRREKLAALLWPDAADSNARSSLRHALWRLRQALAPDPGSPEYIITDNLSVTWNTSGDLWLDTAVLMRGAAGGSLDDRVQALALYGGELLPGVEDDWVCLERERLEGVYAQRMQELLDDLAAAGRWSDVAAQAERWIALGGALEPAYRALMRAHSANGDLGAAAHAYERCREALARALGVAPSEQTQDLLAQIRAARAQPARAEPAPRAIPSVSASLPTLNTAFVGRERELREVDQHLRDPNCRLLTLIGPGGIGKTRLALRAAAQADYFTDGAQFVRLSTVSQGSALVAAIAEALPFSFYGGGDAITQLVDYLRPRQLLLVLDNFEHLLDGAAVIATCLAGAPGVKALVTSQERLNLEGEWLLEVEGMPIPAQDDLGLAEASRYGAVALFETSARRVNANFRLDRDNLLGVLRICRLVAGVPLGIELAASWLRSITVSEIAQEIERSLQFLASRQRDLPERHRSLQAVFDHSWDRLAPQEQSRFARLAAFSGGFSRDAAETVAGASLADLLILLDKSLLRRLGSGRFAMHGLLRAFAQARLDESGEAPAVRQRHLAYFLSLSEAAHLGLRGPEQLEWLQRLDAEHDNLRRALAWARETDPAAGQRLGGNLARFWYLRGTWSEGREWLRSLLALAPATVEASSAAARAARAAALAGLAWLSDEGGSEEPLYRESLGLCRSVGDDWGTAFALRGLGTRLANDGDPAKAEVLLGESLSIFERLQDEWGMGLAKHNLGWAAFGREDNTQAEAIWTVGLEHFRRAGDRWGMAVTLGALTYQARLRDAYAQAAALSEESLALFRALGDRAGMAMSLQRLAQIAFRRSNYALAATLLEETQALHEAIGEQRGQVNAQALLGLVLCYQGRYDAARAVLENCSRMGALLWGPDKLAYILNYQGLVPYMQGQLAQAAGFWERAAALQLLDENKMGAAFGLWGLGAVALAQGNAERAVPLLERSLALFRPLNDRRYLGIVLNSLARAAWAVGRPRLARRRILESLVHRRYPADRQGLAEGLETLAALLAEEAPPETDRAARLLGLADGLRAATGAPLPPVDQPTVALAIGAVRRQFAAQAEPPAGQAAFEAAWQQGRALAQLPLEELWSQALENEVRIEGLYDPASAASSPAEAKGDDASA